MKIIHLTREGDSLPLYLIDTHITLFHKSGAGTEVWSVGDDYPVRVNETPEAIASKLGAPIR